MTVGNGWRLRVVLDVGWWMTLAPLQADVLEWVLPHHRILSKTSDIRLSQSRLKGRVVIRRSRAVRSRPGGVHKPQMENPATAQEGRPSRGFHASALRVEFYEEVFEGGSSISKRTTAGVRSGLRAISSLSGPSRTASRAAVRRSCKAPRRYWASGVRVSPGHPPLPITEKNCRNA
jgi:hypothetical protein